ncbi:hypothetical protein KL86DPRO_20164 [uncultured delta proteobacterium]|uniref:Uncharacterized protein n=1 Tax=uncultured delta proteobacterium TaxID=34034 RepID=A0A212JVR2_9DELT|nr:hypothetical protein KL86DPRO_20164 [uncultured delta proteobacterium]
MHSNFHAKSVSRFPARRETPDTAVEKKFQTVGFPMPSRTGRQKKYIKEESRKDNTTFA